MGWTRGSGLAQDGASKGSERHLGCICLVVCLHFLLMGLHHVQFITHVLHMRLVCLQSYSSYMPNYVLSVVFVVCRAILA